MIVHATPTGWEIIYQRAHGLLAGQLALHWRKDQRPDRWMETLAAITQHDDGGQEWEGRELLTPAGAPKDFTIGGPNIDKAAEAVTHARFQGQYLALLQSMHVCTLYRSFASDRIIAAFIKQQEREQRAWRKALKLTKADADACYRLLYWCDAFSLVLCQRHLPPDGRSIEIGAGPDKTVYMARRCAGDDVPTLTVEPWPFDDPDFQVGIEVTLVDGLMFQSDDDLMQGLRTGEITPRTWRLVKTGC